MNIALMAHDNKKDLMVQFCTAYAGIPSPSTPSARPTLPARWSPRRPGLPIHLFLARVHGGAEQIGARIAYNEIDMVLFFNDPRDEKSCESVSYISRLCDQNNIPFASNVATAEMLVLGLSRGDLDWRDIVNPENQAVYGVILNTNRIISA